MEFIGRYNYGDTVVIPIDPFRAYLIEICDSNVCEDEVTGCKYEVVHSNDGYTDRIKVIATDGEIKTLSGKSIYSGPSFDRKEQIPEYLGTAENCEIPYDSEALYEAACFGLDNDSLEKRSLRRSGDTAIPEVKAARDAFFGQRTYKLRGCDCEGMFDGDPDIFFDGRSKTYSGGLRIDGGCLRVDLGCIVDCDAVEIEYYNTTECSTDQILPQKAGDTAEISEDLVSWHKASLNNISSLGNYRMEYVKHKVHNILCDNGERMRAVYSASKLRYFRMSEPVDRIFSFRVL